MVPKGHLDLLQESCQRPRKTIHELKRKILHMSSGWKSFTHMYMGIISVWLQTTNCCSYCSINVKRFLHKHQLEFNGGHWPCWLSCKLTTEHVMVVVWVDCRWVLHLKQLHSLLGWYCCWSVSMTYQSLANKSNSYWTSRDPVLSQVLTCMLQGWPNVCRREARVEAILE